MNQALKAKAEKALSQIALRGHQRKVELIKAYISLLESQVVGLTSSEAAFEMNLHFGEVWTCLDGESQFRISSADHLEVETHLDSAKSKWKPTNRLMAWERNATDWRKVEESVLKLPA